MAVTGDLNGIVLSTTLNPGRTPSFFGLCNPHGYAGFRITSVQEPNPNFPETTLQLQIATVPGLPERATLKLFAFGVVGVAASRHRRS